MRERDEDATAVRPASPDDVAQRLLCPEPLDRELTDEQQDYVVNAIAKFFDH